MTFSRYYYFFYFKDNFLGFSTFLMDRTDEIGEIGERRAGNHHRSESNPAMRHEPLNIYVRLLYPLTQPSHTFSWFFSKYYTIFFDIHRLFWHTIVTFFDMLYYDFLWFFRHTFWLTMTFFQHTILTFSTCYTTVGLFMTYYTMRFLWQF